MSNRHPILIVDDHPLVRRGIRGLLQPHADLPVVGEAADGLTALHLVEVHRPEVIVLDIVMPVLGGLDLLQQLSQSPVRPRVVVLSLHDDPAYMQQAMRLGAAGYVLKHSASNFLVAAVRDAIAGRFFSSCSPASEAPSRSTLRAPAALADRRELLTAEEQKLLRLLAADTPEDQLANQLARSPFVVSAMRRTITHKLGLQGSADLRQAAAQWAQERGPAR